MLEDLQAGLLVTDRQHAALANVLMPPGLPHLLVDALSTRAGDDGPFPAVAPHDLAYVSYSSGSTGRPKGIVHTHRNVLHHVMNYTNVFHLCPEDRVTLLLSCSFHAAMVNIFAALCNGATLHAWNVKQRGLHGLAEWLHQEHITVLDWVPTLFRHFAATLTGREAFPHLRLVILGSETVSARDAELFRRHFAPPCLMANRLGTTETFNFCVYFAGQHTPLRGPSVPAGYALEDKEVLLLDEAGQRVLGWQVGHIVVRSRHLAAGYWRRPELTRTKFRPDPLVPEQCLYYTGDLGRLGAEGDLEYLGRQDFQVKIRGQRIDTRR
jgi:non-ribosomal peptide synthetase component F